MARNKHPEETVEKILKAAKRLFLEKGYEQTTIQDIVDQLGGLTKGAVYHHFKSKEDIMCALSDYLFAERNPFEAVQGRDDLNGLEKIREVILMIQSPEQLRLNRESLPLLKNPRILAESIRQNHAIVTPAFRALIEEGNADGSINTRYPEELADLITLLPNMWLAPTVVPGTKEELLRRYRCIGEMLAHMGLPLLNDDIMALGERFFENMVIEEESP